MVVKKRRKVTRLRGSRTHGWGRLHRNSGNRGGAGYAGTGKKAHVKKQWRWDDPFGKQGFKMKGPVQDAVTIDIEQVERMVPCWIADKKAIVEKDTVKVDLGALGFTKLLGSGRATRRLHLSVDSATAGASEKVKAAGGEVLVKRNESA